MRSRLKEFKIQIAMTAMFAALQAFNMVMDARYGDFVVRAGISLVAISLYVATAAIVIKRNDKSLRSHSIILAELSAVSAIISFLYGLCGTNDARRAYVASYAMGSFLGIALPASLFAFMLAPPKNTNRGGRA